MCAENVIEVRVYSGDMTFGKYIYIYIFYVNSIDKPFYVQGVSLFGKK